MGEYNYILIFEDGAFIKKTSLSDEDIQHCNMGIMSCIRISDLTQLCDGEWIDIPNNFY